MQESTQMNVINWQSDTEHDVLSKVIVVEHDPMILAEMKSFFEECNLVGYRASLENAPSILGTTIDLGAIFLAEACSDGRDSFDLVKEIHIVRPDLPIFLRLLPDHVPDDLPSDVAKCLSGVFAYGDYTQAKELIDTYLFSRHYPTDFVSEMKAMTLAAIQASFKEMHVEVEQPYIVKDKLIYGELFSLIPLESNWCRGYMTLQTEEDTVMAMIHARKSSVNAPEPNFIHVNAVLGELSNMIWGSFKARYGNKELQYEPGQVRVEIPIIVNHPRKYISFGTDDPQLCFRFKVSDPEGKLASSYVYQKFVFSLDWAPEKYAESNRSVNELVHSGELEIF
jgi:Chemotaxis phosphatase CheX